MRWFVGALGVFITIGAFWLVGDKNKQSPYKLDYNRVGINLPIALNNSLDNDKYPLGEKYLGEHLRDELINQGVEAKLFAIEDVLLSHSYRAGFEIYMRSYPELELIKYHDFFDKDKISVLIETIPYKLEYVKNADIVFTGSVKKNEEYRKLGIVSHFIPQFTKFDRFYPAYKEEYKTKIVYIANQWPESETRKSVKYAMNNGIEIDIYGVNWKDKLTDENRHWLKADQVLNDELKYFYSSADIVLNDTREDMIEAGFISNRIFDVTACGGFIISDYIEGIEKIYGDAIPMYKTEEEFVKLIEYYLAHPEERKEKAMRAYEITKKNFGAKEIVAKMIEIMKGYAVEKNLM